MSRGRTRGRGRGRHIDARGDYGQYSGGGPSNYHEGPQYQDPTSESVAPGLSAYGPQSLPMNLVDLPPLCRRPIVRHFRREKQLIQAGEPFVVRAERQVQQVAQQHLHLRYQVFRTQMLPDFRVRVLVSEQLAVQKPAVSAGSYASLAESSPFVAQVAREPAAVPPLSYSAMDSKPVSARPKSATPPPEPKPVQRPPTPPSPVGPPSGLMVALARLADLESQLDFALAKHSQVVRERELIQEQTKHLEELPIGVEAFEEDLAKLAPAAAIQEPIQ